ncbi:uncharacterized protein A4U43_C01F8690 [Asparagus officinalis]|uniref:Uncharacterized protein n=1 Tax=Asparagus officinalis TaxID=4686 RepID=A0A5P1FN52_ASPOF|nr:uncharacterized protein A4U43_C01F8690 [Asparagus officinalis]
MLAFFTTFFIVNQRLPNLGKAVPPAQQVTAVQMLVENTMTNRGGRRSRCKLAAARRTRRSVAGVKKLRQRISAVRRGVQVERSREDVGDGRGGSTALRAMGTESMLASSITANLADFFTSFWSEEEEEVVAIFGVLEFGGRRRDEGVRKEIGGTRSLTVW